jgi:predicted DsbA family dithiol-disulfide isomerase
MPDSQEAVSDILTIDVVSDVVCPWCYIGKKHLDDALAVWRTRHPDAPEPAVAWHPFQLNPGMPAAGMERGAYLLAKFGNASGGPGYSRVVAAAQAAGLVFNPQNIRRQPNTLRAHALIGAAAGAQQQQHRLVAALFQAYFVDGLDIGDPEVLRGIGVGAGVDEAGVQTAFDEASLAATAKEDERLRDAGIGGVPFFIVGQRVAVSGAQGVEALLDAFDRAPRGRSAGD